MACALPPFRSRPPPDPTPCEFTLLRSLYPSGPPDPSSPLDPPDPPDPPDLPPPMKSPMVQSPSPFCNSPSSISVYSPSSLPSPFWLCLSLHNKISKLVPVRRSLTDLWETEDASLLDSPKRTDLQLSSSQIYNSLRPLGR
ncbi:vegetative cell wall protein gp1-like [Raphanus sativus]|uniref:Vegetative cell wall protein gp1-like n=1 Tax=Raphanus sativus TaxID=3726 RepID=A0A9W3D9X0_RAPSA|nr:vegetative cell wall protein gp1-like [Raphanus sativus]